SARGAAQRSKPARVEGDRAPRCRPTHGRPQRRRFILLPAGSQQAAFEVEGNQLLEALGAGIGLAPLPRPNGLIAHAQMSGQFALRQASPLPQRQRSVGEVEVADLVVIDGRTLPCATVAAHVLYVE